MARSRLLLAAALLVAATAAAGCLASSGAGGGTASAGAPADAGDPAQADDGADGAARNGSANATDGEEVSWQNQTRRGTFAGARAVVGIFGASEAFTVPDDVTTLVLVVRAPDAALSGSIDPPCDTCESDNYDAARGDAYTFTREDPSAGQWSVTFFRDEAGAGSQDYVLEIHRKFGPGQ